MRQKTKTTAGMIYVSAAMMGGTIAGAVLTGLAGRTFPCSTITETVAAAGPLLAIACGYLGIKCKGYGNMMFFFIGLSRYAAAQIISSAPSEIATLLGTDPIVNYIDTHFHSPRTNALLRALLTGDKRLMGQEVITDFRTSGASHILALSGLHLGIIYTVCNRALSIIGNSRTGWRIRAYSSIVICGVYTLMTGAGPSIVRAFLFICLNETAKLHPERSRRPLNIYCTALTIQLVINPLVITSVGFQLSYLAMLGIYLLFPILKDWYPSSSRLDPMKAIWNSISMSVSCQIFTGPLVWFHFRSLPLHFLLTNLLALPLTEALIVSSLLGLERASDFLTEVLLESLRIIASM